MAKISLFFLLNICVVPLALTVAAFVHALVSGTLIHIPLLTILLVMSFWLAEAEKVVRICHVPLTTGKLVC